MTEPNPATPDPHDARPRLALRVGVTGHRKLPDADLPALRAAIGRVLDDLVAVLSEVARRPSAADRYAEKPPLLRLVTPLAEGADRLVAREAVARGWPLAVPLPFPRKVYEDDFPDTRAAFAELIDRASTEVVELDGGRDNETAAYLEVGRFVLRNSDIVIAVWDGKPPGGIGGTGQIVAEALRARIPVLHIHAHAPHQVRVLPGEDQAQPYARPELADSLSLLLAT